MRTPCFEFGDKPGYRSHKTYSHCKKQKTHATHRFIDMTGIVALESLIQSLHQQKITVFIVNLQSRMRDKLARANISETPGKLDFFSELLNA